MSLACSSLDPHETMTAFADHGKLRASYQLCLSFDMNYVSLIVLWLLSTMVSAQDIYPRGCVPLAIHDAIPLIDTSQPVVWMLHNLSDTDLWVTRPATNQGALAGLSTRLHAGKWSALAINQDKTSLPLQCIESKPGHEQAISCAEVLAICQWPKVTFPQQHTGIFWAAENMLLAPIQAYLARQGYVLQPIHPK